MASLINNPQNAMKGLQFAIGAGRVPEWGPGAGGPAPPVLMGDGGGGPGYDVGPAGPPPVRYGGMGKVDAAPIRPTDGTKPVGPAMPGAGGPGDVMGRLDKIEDMMPGAGGPAPPILTGDGGSQTMPMPMGGNPILTGGGAGPFDPNGGGAGGPMAKPGRGQQAMKGLSKAMGLY